MRWRFRGPALLALSGLVACGGAADKRGDSVSGSTQAEQLNAEADALENKANAMISAAEAAANSASLAVGNGGE